MIYFPGLVLNCILGLLIFSDCDTQLEKSWGLRRLPTLVANITSVIDKTLEMRQAGVESNFKLFVTGYALFFPISDGCYNVTWSFWPGSSLYLTKSVRQTFNDMTDSLNSAVEVE